MRRTLFLSLACVLGALTAGCGEAGVSSGATVTVYVSGESLCKGARQELRRNALSPDNGGKAFHLEGGGVGIRVICLDDEPGAGSALALKGANARRATEDSASVGYITEPDPTGASFSRSILAAGGIAQVASRSGQASMAVLLGAIRNAEDPSSLRESVYDALG